MRPFLRSMVAFLIPVLIAAIILEGLLRAIPNDPAFKHDHLSGNADSIELLILGSSAAYRGIDPHGLSARAFNAATVSQPLEYDEAILQKYFPSAGSLKWVVLTVSYGTFFSDLKISAEAWRIKNYVLYHGIVHSMDPSHHAELLNGPILEDVRRLLSYYLQDGDDDRQCDELGSSIRAGRQNAEFDELALRDVTRHTSQAQEREAMNQQHLVGIVDHCEKLGAHVLVVLPPLHDTYRSRMDPAQMDRTRAFLGQLATEHTHVTILDATEDKGFADDMFHDPDHVNKDGAERLTHLVDSVVHAYSR